MKLQSIAPMFAKTASAAALLCLASFGAQATIINFDDQGLTGPSLAASTTATPLSITTTDGIVKFDNGAILTNEASLPADTTSVYYNSFFLPGTSGSTMTLTFASPINNFFLNLYNGQTFTDTFTVSDNTGQSTTVQIAPNTSSGLSLIAFPAVGNVVTITTADTKYDYSIDEIGFNQPTPSVPEPANLALMGLGLVGLVVGARKRAAKLSA